MNQKQDSFGTCMKNSRKVTRNIRTAINTITSRWYLSFFYYFLVDLFTCTGTIRNGNLIFVLWRTFYIKEFSCYNFSGLLLDRISEEKTKIKNKAKKATTAYSSCRMHASNIGKGLLLSFTINIKQIWAI